MKKLIIFLSIFFVSPLPILAQVYITEVMPNTDDDANMEYIDIVNTGCETIDVSGYQIADKEKSYTFAAGSTITSQETYRLGRPTSKIVLNNSNEELSLRDIGGAFVHRFAYASSTKGVAITVPGIVFDDCEVAVPDEDTGIDEEDSGEGDNTEDTTTEEDVLEEDEAENTQIDNDDEIDETGSGSMDDAGAGNTIDETEEGAATGPLDDTTDDATQEEDIKSEEGGEVDSGTTGTGGSDSADEQTQGDVDTEHIQTSNLLGKSGSLAPQILVYSDSDEDGYIDTLEILYDIYITGSVDTSQILIHSNTGGLYDNRVNTASGYILDAEIEDNILRLFIEPSHFQKSKLIINTTTQSELRLRTNGFFGVTSLSGASVDGFLLTASFDSYKEVYEKSEYESIGIEDMSEEIEVISGTTIVTFPSIFPMIQNYTNTTLSGNTFICRETPCRLNLNFESIFNSLYPPSAYSCRITYNGVIEDKCNPSQWSPTSTGGFDVRIIHKATGQYSSQYYPIEWNIIQSASSSSVRMSPFYAASPVPRITLNGKLTKKQIQKDENHIYCYTNTCSLNFDGSDTYDPDGSSMTYSWSILGNVFATKKNPTIQEFGMGEHVVIFTATDATGKTAKEEFRVSVLGDMILPPDSEVAVASDAMSKKPKKKQVIHFFSPPELIIEKSSVGFAKTDSGYRCVTNSASCSTNFALTGTIDGVYYRFSYSHEPAPLYTTNPRSKAFRPGRYTLTLSAHYEKGGVAIWQETLPIEIIRVKKPKANKTTAPKSKTASAEKSSNAIDIIPTAYADDGGSGGSDSELILSFLFFSLLLNVFFLRKKVLNNV